MVVRHLAELSKGRSLLNGAEQVTLPVNVSSFFHHWPIRCPSVDGKVNVSVLSVSTWNTSGSFELVVRVTVTGAPGVFVVLGLEVGVYDIIHAYTLSNSRSNSEARIVDCGVRTPKL